MFWFNSLALLVMFSASGLVLAVSIMAPFWKTFLSALMSPGIVARLTWRILVHLSCILKCLVRPRTPLVREKLLTLPLKLGQPLTRLARVTRLLVDSPLSMMALSFVCVVHRVVAQLFGLLFIMSTLQIRPPPTLEFLATLLRSFERNG